MEKFEGSRGLIDQIVQFENSNLSEKKNHLEYKAHVDSSFNGFF